MEHPYGYIKDNKVYLREFLNQPDRVIGEVKEDEASTIKYFEDRFTTLKEKIAQLKKDIEENQNKGSFLMKLVHLKDSLLEYDALGDFIPLIDELEQLQEYLEDIIKKNREKNLEIKKGLILEAEALKNSTEWKETADEFKNLKMRWIKTGPVEKEFEEEMEESFNNAIDTFFENRKNFFEDMAVQAEVNIKIYEKLVIEARAAFDNPDAKRAFEISKRIQKEWKAAGRVPAEKRQPLWDEFSKLNNRIFSRFRRTMETGPQMKPWELMKKMESMTDEMKKLAYAETNPDGVSSAKRLQAEWKKLPQRKPKEANLIMRSFTFFSEIVFEKLFLERLAMSKYEDFNQKDKTEQKKIKMGILRDLIHRDESELATVKDNAENFRTNEEDFEVMMRRKIGTFKRKIDVKTFILKELSNK
ncbi:DUF349 domain-containing protein [Aquiflexum gelatinilyticum]|uniref:DUF349 domain-containing protein n=1 Tax=Aquiflexum gelatinilyticum TaxID=2961943 RepID=A0A9X2P9M5_9BACT|nr:DUF349 domain-containing protein [Aquiflexum gelatinilyticum]MCR9015957.1 DUF349 domain-containing protein [Aquiflexum gelatinilyticum]MCS4436016.1 DUF349 domain-containing protein [Aquiflexum gelatinilyticum]